MESKWDSESPPSLILDLRFEFNLIFDPFILKLSYPHFKEACVNVWLVVGNFGLSFRACMLIDIDLHAEASLLVQLVQVIQHQLRVQLVDLGKPCLRLLTFLDLHFPAREHNHVHLMLMFIFQHGKPLRS